MLLNKLIIVFYYLVLNNVNNVGNTDLVCLGNNNEKFNDVVNGLNSSDEGGCLI